ncbi:MAG: M55 family metallopeptidase [Oscillospiraceae bacterium]|nr:M55 family metallopeptidase [Oscillospiraceae bacterium]
MRKIYIHTDLEGVSGIVRDDMIEPGGPDHRYCIERLMADTNAAIDGAFLGGADHVTVLDSHMGGGNFDVSLLDGRAELDRKLNGKWWGMMDGSYHGTFFIGAHGMAGTLNGFLDHTQDSVGIYNYVVNGRRMGELAQWAMVSAHYGVPLIMMSGDVAAVCEATQFFPGVEAAAVKAGVSRNRAVALDLSEAEGLIRRAAKRAVEKAERPKAFTPILPMEVVIEFTRADHCDRHCQKPGVERVDARSIRFVSDSYQRFIV